MMFEFDDIKWADGVKRKFGDHGNSYAYLPARDGVIHVRTGNKSEVFVKLDAGKPSIPGFGPRMQTVFSENPEGIPGDPTELTGSSFYLTEDGVDPLSTVKTGHPFIPRVPRESSALKPNTDYYLRFETLDPGAPGFQDRPTKIVYTGTDQPDLGGEQVILNTGGENVAGVRVDLGVLGGRGTFIPD